MERFKNMLFVANSEVKDTEALQRAVSLATNNQAQLTVVSILDKFKGSDSKKISGISLSELHKSLKAEQQSELENLVLPFRKKIQVSTKVLEGTPFLVLIREVLRSEIDLVIKMVGKVDVMDRLLGSTDMNLLRKCPCPVWLIKSSSQENYKRILVAVDFDPSEQDTVEEALNLQLLEMSVSLALAESCELHIVHVWSAYGESMLRYGRAKRPEAEVDAYVNEIKTDHQRLLKELVTNVAEKIGKDAEGYLKPSIHLIKGIAKNAIPKLASELKIDLVMMGTVGRTGIPGFLMGNTAETILNKINCSVLALKPRGFVTPATLEE